MKATGTGSGYAADIEKLNQLKSQYTSGINASKLNQVAGAQKNALQKARQTYVKTKVNAGRASGALTTQRKASGANAALANAKATNAQRIALQNAAKVNALANAKAINAQKSALQNAAKANALARAQYEYQYQQSVAKARKANVKTKAKASAKLAKPKGV